MILNIIEKKKNKQALTKEEINFFVKEYVEGNIEEYQISALLMAILLNGMNESEVIALTDAMLYSGDVIDLSIIEGVKVDKHSTGGVGDKTTLVLAPLVASCGLKVAKMSGRGLGHTGGTIDKLESIKNFKTDLSIEDFINQIDQVGLALSGQTGNLVPADKKLYALRDVTATINSIPLIASSIMSKKLASGADKILIDVKVGRGALFTNLNEAEQLAQILITIGNHYNKKTKCIITNMDQPLGYAIGNGLEVKESIDTLKGNGPKDVTELVVNLAAHLVSMGKEIDFNKALIEVQNNLNNGLAYLKFEELIKAQQGDINQIAIAQDVVSIKSSTTGFIKAIDTLKLGEIARKLGAGRFCKDDEIDYGVGLVLSKKIGDYVLQDEELVKVYLKDKNIAINDILGCFYISETLGQLDPLIYKVIEG